MGPDRQSRARITGARSSTQLPRGSGEPVRVPLVVLVCESHEIEACRGIFADQREKIPGRRPAGRVAERQGYSVVIEEERDSGARLVSRRIVSDDQMNGDVLLSEDGSELLIDPLGAIVRRQQHENSRQ